ncbi:MAG: hypothetical protein ACJ8H8_19835 [Geminicoccaceae bacterium]
MTCTLFEVEPAWTRIRPAKARPPRPLNPTPGIGHTLPLAGSRYEGQSGVAPKRPEHSRKVSHRSATRQPQPARYTSSLTMAGVSHQGSLALKKS